MERENNSSCLFVSTLSYNLSYLFTCLLFLYLLSVPFPFVFSSNLLGMIFAANILSSILYFNIKNMTFWYNFLLSYVFLFGSLFIKKEGKQKYIAGFFIYLFTHICVAILFIHLESGSFMSPKDKFYSWLILPFLQFFFFCLIS